MSDDSDWEGNDPHMYDCEDNPIYDGDIYYKIDDVIYSEKTLRKYRRLCEEGDDDGK